MKSLKSLTLSIGILCAATAAQAATINCTPAQQRAHIATLQTEVQTLTTQVRALQSEAAILPQQSADAKPDPRLPLGAQFDIATGG